MPKWNENTFKQSVVVATEYNIKSVEMFCNVRLSSVIKCAYCTIHVCVQKFIIEFISLAEKTIPNNIFQVDLIRYIVASKSIFECLVFRSQSQLIADNFPLD